MRRPAAIARRAWPETRGRTAIARIAAAAIAAALLAVPATANAHAVLVRTLPSAGGTVDRAPAEVRLTFSEPIEPRFAAISVTGADGRRRTAGNPSRPKGDPTTVVVPLQGTSEGWYLVYWRVISADGHPVRGAFTYAVGPNPGPAPQFQVPTISETAATPRLLAARWLVTLAAMAAIGLFVLRMLIARPATRVVTRAFAITAAAGLLATPAYLVLATAQFTLRSPLDLGALAPLLDVSAFGRGYLDLELTLALFTFAAGIAIALDRPQRARRSVAELLATTGALIAAAAVLLIPGVTGHAGQTSPRALAIALDALHLAAGAIWIGGLIGLILLWRTAPGTIQRALPRFSTVALTSVLTLVATGVVAAIIHLPTLSSLWTTGYGQALLAKLAILAAALLLAAANLLRTRPRAQAGRPTTSRLVSGEVIFLAGAVLAAAVLTSLAPPAKAVADLQKPAANLGPGPVTKTLTKNGYTLAIGIAPNRAAVPNRFTVTLTRGNRPVTNAQITAGFAMLDMEMGHQAYRLHEQQPGTYGREAPALVMVGHWGLTFDVEPADGRPFSVTVLDKANG